MGNGIISLIVVAIITEVISLISKNLFKKYRIMERKLFVFVFFSFLFGLLFIVLPVVYLLITISNESTLTLLNGFLYAISFVFGAFLLGIMVWRVVQPDEPTAINVNKPPVIQPFAITEPPTTARKIRKPLSGWIYIAGGLLLTAICIFLFWEYGPQHDPPGLSGEHQQIDTVISYVCASVAIVGLVIFGAGVWKLTHRRKAQKFL